MDILGSIWSQVIGKHEAELYLELGSEGKFTEKNNLFVFATTEATLLLALEIGSVNLSFSVCGVRVRRYKDSLL